MPLAKQLGIAGKPGPGTEQILLLYIGKGRGQSHCILFFTCWEKYSFGIEVIFWCSRLSVSLVFPLLAYLRDTWWHGRATAISHSDCERGLALRKVPKQPHQLLGIPVLSSNTRERACTRLGKDRKGHFVLTELGSWEKQGIFGAQLFNSSKPLSSTRPSTCCYQMLQ